MSTWPGNLRKPFDEVSLGRRRRLVNEKRPNLVRCYIQRTISIFSPVVFQDGFYFITKSFPSYGYLRRFIQIWEMERVQNQPWTRGKWDSFTSIPLSDTIWKTVVRGPGEPGKVGTGMAKPFLQEFTFDNNVEFGQRDNASCLPSPSGSFFDTFCANGKRQQLHLHRKEHHQCWLGHGRSDAVTVAILGKLVDSGH